MSRRIELEIRRLLIELKETERVADEVMRQWSSFPYLDDEADTAAQFLVNCGLFVSLIDKVNAQIQKKHKVTWPYYAEAIGLCSLEVEQKVIDAIFAGAKEQGLINYLARSSALNRVDPKFKDINKNFKNEQKQQRQIKIEELFSKIEFLKSQRLFEEEKKALAALAVFSPNHPDLKKMNYEFEERWARHLISQSPPKGASTHTDEKIQEKWKLETQEVFAPAFASLQEKAIQHPEMAFDFAIACYFFEFYDEAVVLLEQAPPSQTVDWLRLELFLQNRRFIDALEICERLERIYPSDPEVNFATTLGKAKALWGLGRSAEAIDLLTSIQNVRPNYRSVSSLLQQWREGRA